MSEELNSKIANKFIEQPQYSDPWAKLFLTINNFLDKPEEWISKISMFNTGIGYVLHSRKKGHSIAFEFSPAFRRVVIRRRGMPFDYLACVYLPKHISSTDTRYLLSILEEALEIVKNPKIEQTKLRWFKVYLK